MLHAILLLQLLASSPQAHDAEELVHASMRHYDLGAFEEALREAELAYRLYPLAQILFNIGQCHRALGHWEKALVFYERYLSKLPGAPNRTRVEALIAEAQYHVQLEGGQAESVAPPVAPPVAPTAPPSVPALPVAPAQGPPATAAEPAPAAAVEPLANRASEPAPSSHTAAYVLGAVAVASLAVMVVGIVEVENFQSLLGRLNNPSSYTSFEADHATAVSEAPSIPVWEWVAGITGTVAVGSGTAAVLTW